MKHSHLSQSDPAVAELIRREEARQRDGIELIASENYASLAVLEALGSVLTNKYSEGYPGRRYYAGNEVVDEVEQLAIDRAKQLFGAEHINVQPLSGAPANLAAYAALLAPGETVLGMHLAHGGHLTHGHPVTFVAKVFNFIRYATVKATGQIDYEEMERLAREHRPKLILVGYSAYSRDIDYGWVKKIADAAGARTMADIAHIAGLIAVGLMNNPITAGFDVVTTTTHKTLRGPRGGLIMCRAELAPAIDKAVFPMLQGGPHDHVTAAKAVAFGEALQPQFKDYARQILANAKAMEAVFRERDFTLCFGGTDNHLLLIDLTNKGVTGRQAQTWLDEIGISLNMNMVPDDPRKPLDPSGIRLGTPAMTTRGMKEAEARQLAAWIADVLERPDDAPLRKKLRAAVRTLARQFPVPGVTAA